MNLVTEIAPKLAEQYADMLSLDFRRRHTLLNSWNHFANDLLLWDKRLQTYIEGLKYLRKDARIYFDGWSNSLLTRGDVFAMGSFAFHTDDARLLENSLSLILAMPHLIQVAESVIAWAPAKSMLWETAFSSPTIRVMAAYIRNDLPHISHLKDDEISRLMASPAAIPGLVKMLHQQQHPDYFSIITNLISTDNPQTRLGVITAILTHHLPYRDLAPEKHLLDLLARDNEIVRNKAMRLYLCHTDSASPDRIINPGENVADQRLYLTALGYSGIAANIEILKQFLDKPEYARLAATAIVMITGASPESAGWLSQHPLTGITSTDDDPDGALSWPEKSAFECWWKNHSYQFDASKVYVAGNPATKQGLQQVLQHGCLAVHPLAKSRLCHLTRESINEDFIPTFFGSHHDAR
ncbi:hypothetical protein M977_03001 [Buttiauxella gaviniae ATCC 51604]|uniref:Uncharacterized protein n=1 Tax=Buttiauxella gaviniae ATCC 51604 TaxID=1354253 RepID=A0A1B7HU54_9ENTR|nr:hypothetical protein [Buttiauxella gaviniae]OAT19178.1 hypothetical protein M977_03001 [Buttiauxella gaviniae ATCC 51604]